MIEIIPAIIPKSFDDLSEAIEPVAKYVSLVQIDIVDGHFVKSKSWPYVGDHGEFENLQTEHVGMPHWEDLDYEVDLMVSHPEDVVDSWITVGAKSIIVHVESTKKIDEIIKNIRSRFPLYESESGKKVSDIEFAIALNIDTPTETILPYLEDVNFIQFMGIAQIGYQGEPFDERVLHKIHEFHNTHPEIILGIDGGVTLENAGALFQAGIRRFVSGSAILKSTNIKKTLEDFKNSARM